MSKKALFDLIGHNFDLKGLQTCQTTFYKAYVDSVKGCYILAGQKLTKHSGLPHGHGQKFWNFIF